MHLASTLLVVAGTLLLLDPVALALSSPRPWADRSHPGHHLHHRDLGDHRHPHHHHHHPVDDGTDSASDDGTDGELVDDSDDDTDSDFVWEDDDNPFANDGDPFSDSIFENLDDGPDDPPDLSFDVEGCGRHLDAAYLNRTLFSTTYDILAKVALSDPVRYPMFSDLKILNYMVSWDYCRAFVRRYRHRTTQTFRAAARRFKAECGKALAIRATGTVYWLAESNIAPPHGNTGLEASMGLERSRFAKYEFPLLCRNQHVTTFYRVNRRMLDDDDMTEVERQDITELVMAMRREGTCPPVQMTGDPFPQTLTGEPMDDED